MQRLVAVAARGSWILPLAGLTVVGFAEKGAAIVPLSAHVLVRLAVASSLAGLAIGALAWLASRGAATTRWQAVAGMVTGAFVLLVVWVAASSGEASGHEVRLEMRAAGAEAMRDFPGWNGGAVVDGASVSAIEIDPRAALAKLVARPGDAPSRVVLFAVDNRRGTHEVALDPSTARLHRADGGVTGSKSAGASPVRVGAGSRSDTAAAFFAPDESLRDVSSIDVSVDGVTRSIPGRYFTLEEKHAIDAQRGR